MLEEVVVEVWQAGLDRVRHVEPVGPEVVADEDRPQPHVEDLAGALPTEHLATQIDFSEQSNERVAVPERVTGTRGQIERWASSHSAPRVISHGGRSTSRLARASSCDVRASERSSPRRGRSNDSALPATPAQFTPVAVALVADLTKP